MGYTHIFGRGRPRVGVRAHSMFEPLMAYFAQYNGSDSIEPYAALVIVWEIMYVAALISYNLAKRLMPFLP